MSCPLLRRAGWLSRATFRALLALLGLAGLGLGIGAPLSLRAAQAETLITARDLFQIVQLGSPALSPDGRLVVYSARTTEPDPARPGAHLTRTQLWLAALDGRTPPRPLTQAASGSTDPAWSPDGTQLAFVRRAGEHDQIWILPLNGGEAYTLTRAPHGASAPRWSPDGTRLLFRSTLGSHEVEAQRHARATTDTPADLPSSAASGSAVPVAPPVPEAGSRAAPTLPVRNAPGGLPGWASERPGRAELERSPASPVTPAIPDESRDGDMVRAMPVPAGAHDDSPAARRTRLAQAEAAGNPRVTWRLDFQGEADLAPAPEFTQLYVVDTTTRTVPAEATCLTPGFVDLGHAEWLPDGLTVVASGFADLATHPDRERRHRLYLIDVATRTPRLLRADPAWSLTAPVASPDGATIACLASPARVESDFSYGQSVVALLPRAGGELRPLATALDRSAMPPRWSPDGRWLYFTAPSRGGQPLHRVATSGRAAAERLTAADTGIRAFDVGRDGQLALVQTTAANPYELLRTDARGRGSRALTAHNAAWLRARKLSALEPRRFTRDGLEIDAWVMKPPYFEAGRRHPLLLQIHGGPAAMWGPGEPSMWHEFQFFTARGYVVVFANPRGSGGYGEKFQRANFQNWGPGPAADVLAAADLVVSEPWIDPARQFITGGSYGGYLTAYVLTETDRFRAAIAARGVYDLTTFFGEGNAWRLVPWHFGGYPWEPAARAMMEAQSPFLRVDRITTPLLIKHGDADLRTGTSQSEMLYKALKVLGRPAEYVRYPRATHELSRSGEPDQRLDRLERFEEFFARYRD